MKKISLKNLDSLGIEKLSRENLRNVQGGNFGCRMPGEVFFKMPGDICCYEATMICESDGDEIRCACDNIPEGGGDTNPCDGKPQTCNVWDPVNVTMKNGTCKARTNTYLGVTNSYCECSVGGLC